MNINIRMLRHLDKLTILVVLILIGLGLVAISSAFRAGASPAEVHHVVVKQIIAGAIGLVALLTLLVVDYEEFAGLSRVIYGVSVLLLLAVLVVGKVTNGAQSWLGFGPVQIQPSELAKLFCILTLGHRLARMDRLDRTWDLTGPALHVIPIVLLVLLQNDTGTALVLVVIAGAMVYIAGYPGWKLALLIGLPILLFAGWFAAHLRWDVPMWPLQEYQIDRLRVFVDPTADLTGSGYQVFQSKAAIGSGGLLGQGLYHGALNQLGFIPYNDTDFIFAVIGEELGLAGGAAVLLLYLILFFRMMSIASSARDRYGALIATGVTAWLAFHVLENVGMTMGVMPVTGIPLPFISNGGSALLSNLMAVGLVLNVGMRREPLTFS